MVDKCSFSETYQQNLGEFYELYPQIGFLITYAELEPFHLIKDKSGYLNASRAKDSFVIYGSDTSKELKHFNKKYKNFSPDTLYLYGLGLGYHALETKQWLEEKKERRLVILEDDLAVISAFLHSAHAREVFSHPQIRVEYHAEFTDSLLHSLTATVGGESPLVIGIDSYIERKMQVLNNLQKKIPLFTVCHIAISSEIFFSHILTENILNNLSHLSDGSYLNALKGSLNGLPFIICGAGPSLNDAIEDLRHLQNQYVIIGVGSALTTLTKNGIKPHLGVIIDPNEQEYIHLRPCAPHVFPIIYGGRVSSKALDLFTGQKVYVSSFTTSNLEEFFEKKMSLDSARIGLEMSLGGFSVTTLAVAVAEFLGAKSIIFCGVDLAYVNNTHYAEGIPHVSKGEMATSSLLGNRVKSVNQNKEEVLTSYQWLLESDVISSYAEKFPHIQFINASVKGLGFKGIPNMSLKQVLDKHSRIELNIEALIHQLLQQARLSSAQFAQLKSAKQELRQSLIQCQEYVRTLTEEDSSSGEKVWSEWKLKEELAYEIFLRPLEGAVLNRIQRKNSSNPLDLYKVFYQIIDSNLQVLEVDFSSNTSSAL